jgi:5-methylcytosine-specific restriction endonuclease McrA
MGKKENARIRRSMLEALEEQGGCCFYCCAPLLPHQATADHRKPKSRGGTDCRENIAAACFPCNKAKADLAESWFFAILNRKTPPRIGGRELLLVWATRRMFKRARKACRRLERASLVNRRVPVASQEQFNDRAGA